MLKTVREVGLGGGGWKQVQVGGMGEVEERITIETKKQVELEVRKGRRTN